MIHTIRPHQLFSRLGDDNHVHLVIPAVSGQESMTVFALETELLIAAARIVKAKTILEIGTSMGYTAMHLVMNTEAEITTMDIKDKPVVFRGTEWGSRISRLIGDSRKSRFYRGIAYDMIFIDGDHSYAGVEHDTELVFDLLPKVVVWHDFQNPAYPDVTKFLTEFAQDHDLIHVADSWLAFWFRDGLEVAG
jgi:hypothetical protein